MRRNLLISALLMVVSLSSLCLRGLHGLEGFLLSGAFLLAGLKLSADLEAARKPILQRLGCIFVLVIVAYCAAAMIEFGMHNQSVGAVFLVGIIVSTRPLTESTCARDTRVPLRLQLIFIHSKMPQVLAV